MATVVNLTYLKLLSAFLALAGVCHATKIAQNPSFSIDYDNNTFVKDGEPFRYISGSIHYSRVPYQYWDDRLHKIAASGLNAIQIYVPWNFHETKRGHFDFMGQKDIVSFLKTAQKYGLVVILRPGPYICAEWEFGGLPAWLMNYPGIKVRTMDKNYIEAVDSWYTKLYTVLQPMLYENGGPIISVQLENEYGSYYACDYDYLRFLAKKARSLLGPNVVLFTTDGDGDAYLKCGSIPEAYATIDFGVTYDPAKNFAIQRHKEPKGPLVNSEYYTGWMDHWGEPHSLTPTAAVAKSLDLILALGANVNLYMFEGGTNFGFWSGADIPSHLYMPTTTSYGHDAPMSEAGDILEKYIELRKIIQKYNPTTMEVPPSTPKAAYGNVNLEFVGTLLSYVSGQPTFPSKYPLNMEALQQYYGFTFYKHVLKANVKDGLLNVTGIRDRGYISVGNEEAPVPVGVVQRERNVTLTLTASAGDILYILVENQGRVGYGNRMNSNTKGLIANVTLDGQNLTDWVHIPVPLTSEDIGHLHSNQKQMVFRRSADEYELPALYKGMLEVKGQPQDTYLDMSLWTKGQVFINGENLGRYWPHNGPQVRLYVPKYVLQEGSNTVVFLELEKSPCQSSQQCYINFTDEPLVNGSVTPIFDNTVKGNKVKAPKESIIYPQGRSGPFFQYNPDLDLSVKERQENEEVFNQHRIDPSGDIKQKPKLSTFKRIVVTVIDMIFDYMNKFTFGYL